MPTLIQTLDREAVYLYSSISLSKLFLEEVAREHDLMQMNRYRASSLREKMPRSI